MKIQRISTFQKQIVFPNLNNSYSEYLQSFERTTLGSIYRAIPWSTLLESFGLSDCNKGLEVFFHQEEK